MPEPEPYLVEFGPSAQLQFDDLPEDGQARLQASIDSLATNPRPAPPLGAKLQGGPPLYRLKLPPYRVVYRIDSRRRVVTITWVGLRRDAYRAR